MNSIRKKIKVTLISDHDIFAVFNLISENDHTAGLKACGSRCLGRTGVIVVVLVVVVYMYIKSRNALRSFKTR